MHKLIRTEEYIFRKIKQPKVFSKSELERTDMNPQGSKHILAGGDTITIAVGTFYLRGTIEFPGIASGNS